MDTHIFALPSLTLETVIPLYTLKRYQTTIFVKMRQRWTSVYLAMVIVLIGAVIIEALPKRRAIDGDPEPKPPRRQYVSTKVPKEIGFNETVEFKSDENWSHIYTPSVTMKYDECFDYDYFVQGKRTRLRVYMCRLSEGGRCTLSKHKELPEDEGEGNSGCNPLQAWMGKPDEYAVHVQFERRPRKFADKEKERRWRRRHARGNAYIRTVGSITIYGVKPCNDVCLG
uniref:Secreted protein n=2 Tax=Panagrellus redivivus TaxID=6233 RepID=A0A7E4ZRY9_PANRE